MRSRNLGPKEDEMGSPSSHYSNSGTKFKPEHGQQLALMSLLAFILSFLSGSWILFLRPEHLTSNVCLTVLHIGIVLGLGQSFLPCHFKVWLLASILGATLSLGLLIALMSGTIYPFGMYVIIMALFHFGEFFVTALTNPANLSIDSFLLNHSKSYWIAAVASWLEFFVELFFVPRVKIMFALSLFGFVVCLAGDVLRKMAMFNAGKCFNHIVQYSKNDDHVLVTSGIYSICRHPSYVGWFYWSIGTQVLLCNPLCFIAYAVVSWKFFNERIYVEECTLLNFFGVDYRRYQQAVPVGIPYITGFKEHMM